MTAATAGSDLLVVTGGVGDHGRPVREAVAERLAHVGLAAGPDVNRAAAGDADVSASGATACTVVFTARGDREIRRQSPGVLGDQVPPETPASRP